MINQEMPKNVHDKPGLIPRQVMPENLESPINNVLSWITPNELFYARNHFPYPSIQLESWALYLGGEVEKSLNIKCLGIMESLYGTVGLPNQ